MDQQISTKVQDAAVSDYGISIAGMPMGLAIMFNDRLYDRCKQIAQVMARADGFTPPHLIGKSEACFAVVTRSITWKLDPQAVAQSTYQTPGGRIGYEGKLIQAILENSGRLVGPVTYELFGDWDKINGKFDLKRGNSGKEYPAPTWTRLDAKGVGVIVSAQVKGELERRTLKVNLDEMFPLNSTLWATRPSQQICYTACRAFANIAAPGLLMGEPFDVDRDASAGIRDITPARPEKADFVDQMPEKAEAKIEIVNPETGEVMDEYGAFEAREDGMKARDANKPLASIPQHIEQLGLGDAWQDGWRSRDEEIAAEGKATKP